MDYRYPPDILPFRMAVRQWLQDNLDEELRGQSNRGALDPEQLDALRRWNRKLADAGYAAISWPTEYGGRGAGVMEQVVLRSTVTTLLSTDRRCGTHWATWRITVNCWSGLIPKRPSTRASLACWSTCIWACAKKLPA